MARRVPALVEVLVTRSRVCVRCGKPVIGTESQHCGLCLKILNRAADDAFKRQARKEQVERQKREGGRPWRWR
jgi:hypothetical protein